LGGFSRQGNEEERAIIDLNKVAEAALLLAGNLIKRSTHHFTFEPAPSPVLLWADFHRIEQVLLNLITNACQALTSSEQALRVSVRCNLSTGAQLEVRDGGVGIAQADLARVFDPFFTTKRSTGGTGLGLAISQQIVAAHGGQLVLESVAGEGTRALLTLPLPPKGASV